ncbi:ABC transporter ATP-binding protein [Microbacterium sp. NPDC089320]|uniref:ABC transporter ATP-binding protein n=1 Tax=Microbacterium sp. NPDC089320 TaxID=3155182 RepID=UPI00342C4852
MSAGDGLRAHVVVPREHFAVDVSLQVGAGETVAVMGPSGAGKSTLLQTLAGLEPLRAGEIAVEGRVVDRVARPRVRSEPMHRGVVLLGQKPRLFPHLSARENVAFGPRSVGAEIRAARSGADEWLARVGLPGSGERMPHELSGGEQQRVAVARALAASPRVVLLDEPLVALDPETAGDIRRMLRDQLVSTTTVAVTHDAADAVALADRLIVVEGGRVTQEGPVREVLAAPASGFIASVAGLNRLVGVASGGGWRSGEVLLTSDDPASRALATTDGVALAAVFRPGDVRLAEEGAESWPAVVTRIEPTLVGARVHTDAGAVDLSLAAAGGLAVGDRIRLRVHPTLVRFVAML